MADLERLIEAVRPRGKTPFHDPRPTIAAFFWRHENGVKWRSIPAEPGPWWRAAQLFMRWAKRGVWERLLALVQEQHRAALGMTFSGWHEHQGSPQSGGCPKKGASFKERDHREAQRRDAPVVCPKWAYRRCLHLVENLWARLKEWCAVAIRYEKTATSFLAIIHIAAAADWIKP